MCEAAPICRQLREAGSYNGDGLAPKIIHVPNGKNYLQIHPKFLHSNATSHKWAFGAVAELIDNAVDEGKVITSIGFVKEAPDVKVHGFNIYHRNRLILPFWKVINTGGHKGRGVVGVLEANFIQPTHNKQDFERTPIFQKLEIRLKLMALEYWDIHFRLIGHQSERKLKKLLPMKDSFHFSPYSAKLQSVALHSSSPVVDTYVAPPGVVTNCQLPVNTSHILMERSGQSTRVRMRRTERDHSPECVRVKRRTLIRNNVIDSCCSSQLVPANSSANLMKDPMASALLQENKRLSALCLEYEQMEEELDLRVIQLKNELLEVEYEYERLINELGHFGV